MYSCVIGYEEESRFVISSMAMLYLLLIQSPLSFFVICQKGLILHPSMDVQIYSFSFERINILCSFVKVCTGQSTSNHKHLSTVGNWTEMYD